MTSQEMLVLALTALLAAVGWMIRRTVRQFDVLTKAVDQANQALVGATGVNGVLGQVKVNTAAIAANSERLTALKTMVDTLSVTRLDRMVEVERRVDRIEQEMRK